MIAALIAWLAGLLGVSALGLSVFIAIALVLASFYLMFTPRGRGALGWFLTNFIHDAFAVAIPIVDGLSGTADTVVNAFIRNFRGNGQRIISDLTKPAGDA